MRIDAYCINGTVNAYAARQFLNDRYRVFFFEVDDFRALRSRHVKPGRDVINSKDPAGIHQERAGNGELTHRTTTKHNNRIARLNLGDVGSKVGGREDIG